MHVHPYFWARTHKISFFVLLIFPKKNTAEIKAAGTFARAIMSVSRTATTGVICGGVHRQALAGTRRRRQLTKSGSFCVALSYGLLTGDRIPSLCILLDICLSLRWCGFLLFDTPPRHPPDNGECVWTKRARFPGLSYCPPSGCISSFRQNLTFAQSLSVIQK